MSFSWLHFTPTSKKQILVLLCLTLETVFLKNPILGFCTNPTFWISSGTFEGTFVGILLFNDVTSSLQNALYATVKGAC